jgi:replicative DNA helicase
MNIVEHIAMDLGKPVGIFSLEMSSRQLTQRLLCSRAKVNLQRVRNGFLSERYFPMLTATASRLASSKILIDDTAELVIGEMRERARKLRDRRSVELIVIDYLNLVRPDSSGVKPVNLPTAAGRVRRDALLTTACNRDYAYRKA